VHPPTDLIFPGQTARRRQAAGRTLSLPRSGPLRGFEIKVVAQYLGMTPAELRAELASGATLRQIATDRGVTLARLRQHVLKAVRSHLRQAFG
jgi:hypothetical protein